MRYNIVENSKRKQLIELVYGDDPITIREACGRLGIKLTTAKTILKIYRREGRISKLTFRQNKLEEEAEILKEEHSPQLQSKEKHPSHSQLPRVPLQTCKEPEEKGLKEFSSQFQTRSQQLPGEPEEIVKVKLPSVPSQINQFSPRELSDYLSNEVAQFTERVKQLDYISNSYRLLDTLYRVLKDSENKIMAYQSNFRTQILPTVMNEFLKRQGPMLAQLISLPSSSQRENSEDEATPSFLQNTLGDVRK